jgi:hypothetical protein
VQYEQTLMDKLEVIERSIYETQIDLQATLKLFQDVKAEVEMIENWVADTIQIKNRLQRVIVDKHNNVVKVD